MGVYNSTVGAPQDMLIKAPDYLGSFLKTYQAAKENVRRDEEMEMRKDVTTAQLAAAQETLNLAKFEYDSKKALYDTGLALKTMEQELKKAELDQQLAEMKLEDYRTNASFWSDVATTSAPEMPGTSPVPVGVGPTIESAEAAAVSPVALPAEGGEAPAIPGPAPAPVMDEAAGWKTTASRLRDVVRPTDVATGFKTSYVQASNMIWQNPVMAEIMVQDYTATWNEPRWKGRHSVADMMVQSTNPDAPAIGKMMGAQFGEITPRSLNDQLNKSTITYGGKEMSYREALNASVTDPGVTQVLMSYGGIPVEMQANIGVYLYRNYRSALTDEQINRIKDVGGAMAGGKEIPNQAPLPYSSKLSKFFGGDTPLESMAAVQQLDDANAKLITDNFMGVEAGLPAISMTPDEIGAVVNFNNQVKYQFGEKGSEVYGALGGIRGAQEKVQAVLTVPVGTAMPINLKNKYSVEGIAIAQGVSSVVNNKSMGEVIDATFYDAHDDALNALVQGAALSGSEAKETTTAAKTKELVDTLPETARRVYENNGPITAMLMSKDMNVRKAGTVALVSAGAEAARKQVDVTNARAYKNIEQAMAKEGMFFEAKIANNPAIGPSVAAVITNPAIARRLRDSEEMIAARSLLVTSRQSLDELKKYGRSVLAEVGRRDSTIGVMEAAIDKVTGADRVADMMRLPTGGVGNPAMRYPLTNPYLP